MSASTPVQQAAAAIHITERKRALFDIEDDLTVLHAAAGALQLAFADLVSHGDDGSALAQTIWFTAVHIEAAVARIYKILDDEKPEAKAPCACQHDHHEEVAP